MIAKFPSRFVLLFLSREYSFLKLVFIKFHSSYSNISNVLTKLDTNLSQYDNNPGYDVWFTTFPAHQTVRTLWFQSNLLRSGSLLSRVWCATTATTFTRCSLVDSRSSLTRKSSQHSSWIRRHIYRARVQVRKMSSKIEIIIRSGAKKYNNSVCGS